MSGAEGAAPLPGGWRRALLGEVTTVVGGSTPRSDTPIYWGGDINWVTPTDLGKLPSRDIDGSERKITRAGFAACGTTMLPIGTVVMSSRAPIGHLGLACIPLCTNQGCKSFVPSKETDSRFLYWALKQAMPAIVALGTGNTFAEVSKGVLKRVFIVAPPLPEQRRIADLLDAAAESQASARAAAERQLGEAKRLLSVALTALFDALEERHPAVPLEEVVSIVGGFGFPLALQGRTDLPFPFIKVSDMGAVSDDNPVVSTAANTVDKALLSALGARVYPAGTIIFPKVGGAVFTNRKRRLGVTATFDNNVMGLVPKEIEPEWVYAWFQTIDLRDLANTQALPSINQARMRLLRLPVPPPPLRKHHLDHLAQLREAFAGLEARATSQLAAIDALPGALLAAAFRGDL